MRAPQVLLSCDLVVKKDLRTSAGPIPNSIIVLVTVFGFTAISLGVVSGVTMAFVDSTAPYRRNHFHVRSLCSYEKNGK